MVVNVEEVRYLVTTGADCIEIADSLDGIRNMLAALVRGDAGEDMVVWRVGSNGRARIVLIRGADGRTLEMDGYQLTWKFPPAQKPA